MLEDDVKLCNTLYINFQVNSLFYMKLWRKQIFIYSTNEVVSINMTKIRKKNSRDLSLIDVTYRDPHYRRQLLSM